MQRDIWHSIFHLSIAATAISFSGHLKAQAEVPSEAPKSLTWKNIEQVEKYLSLKPADENYQKVTWHSTVIAGHQKAQQEDKPLLLWLYFGDPRGNC